jgi:hypothetical protein
VNKTKFLDVAQVFDTWRVVPRAVLFGYAWWVMHVTDNTLSWYQHLPSAERTLEASGLAGAIITAITGMAVWVYRIYADTATDWSPASTRTSVSSTTEVIK